MTLLLPTLTVFLVLAPTPEVYGCVCYLGQEPDQAGKRYGWSLAAQNPCDCTEFRLGGVNMNRQIKPYDVTVGGTPRVSISKGQIDVQPPKCKEDQQARNDTLRQVAGLLKHVSAGKAGVWGVDDRNRIKRRCGCFWTLTSGELKQLDVGINVVWGVSPDNAIYYREVSVCNLDVTSWILVEGSLTHVSVSQKGHVWGVNRHNHIYHRINANVNQIAGSSWTHIFGSLTQVSVGSGGVWGVNIFNQTFYRLGTYSDPDSDPDGSDWQMVEPNDIPLKYVSSGDVIYVVDVSDAVYYRVGTSAENPTGLVWQKIDGKLKQVESISSAFWGVDAQNNVYTNESISYD